MVTRVGRSFPLWAPDFAIESSFSSMEFCSSTTFIDRLSSLTDLLIYRFCHRFGIGLLYSGYTRERGEPVSPAGSTPGAGNGALWHSGNLCLVNWSPLSTLQQVRREKRQLLLPLQKGLKQRVELTFVVSELHDLLSALHSERRTL